MHVISFRHPGLADVHLLPLSHSSLLCQMAPECFAVPQQQHPPPLLDTALVKHADSGNTSRNTSAGTKAFQGKAESSIPLGYRKLIFLKLHLFAILERVPVHIPHDTGSSQETLVKCPCPAVPEITHSRDRVLAFLCESQSFPPH